MKLLPNSLKLGCAIFLIVLSTACNKEANVSQNNKNGTVIAGWQTAWSPSGQIAQTLIHTDIAKKQNVDLNLIGFLYGPDMNEAAMNHNINCLNTGNVPATSLLSKSANWIVIARLIRQPLSIIARSDSGIHKVEDLRGKTLGIGFGTGPHPYLLCLLKKHGLWDGKSPMPLKLMNIAPSEQVMALQQKAVDAIATWEPQSTIAILKKLGVVINEESSPGLILIEKKFAHEHSEIVVRLLQAYLQAEYYVAMHKELTDQWFVTGSQYSKELINKIKIIEPNLLTKDPHKINLDLSKEDIDRCQQHADAMFAAGLIKQAVNIKDCLDLSFLQKAQTEWQQTPLESKSVSIVNP